MAVGSDNTSLAVPTHLVEVDDYLVLCVLVDYRKNCERAEEGVIARVTRSFLCSSH